MAAWIRYAHEGHERFGRLDGDAITPWDAAPWLGGKADGAVVALSEVTLLAPVTPMNFIGLWNNFHAAAAKHGYATPAEPLTFLKSPGSLVGPEATIIPPPHYEGRTIFEAELGIVIGATCKDVDEATAEAAIFGFTCVNDVTALDLLHADGSFPQWARAKGCDTYGPAGPAVVSGLDWRTLVVRARLGGRERQNYPASDMIFTPPAIISRISREMTLHPGDLISCGTSLGALPMRAGGVIEVEIEGIGILRNVMG